MGHKNYKIRLATIPDVQKLTELHCKSFKPEDHVPMMLGRNYVKGSYSWLVSSKDSYVLVAENEDKIIGLIAVCDGAFTKAMFISCLPEFIFSIVSKPKRLFNRMLWKRLLRRPDMAKSGKNVNVIPGFAQMTIGAVEKDFRGEGVFGELVEATKEFSKQRGSKAIRAGVYKKNQQSRAVFIKSGWPEIRELETIETVFYVAFFDKILAREFGIDMENF